MRKEEILKLFQNEDIIEINFTEEKTATVLGVEGSYLFGRTKYCSFLFFKPNKECSYVFVCPTKSEEIPIQAIVLSEEKIKLTTNSNVGKITAINYKIDELEASFEEIKKVLSNNSRKLIDSWLYNAERKENQKYIYLNELL